MTEYIEYNGVTQVWAEDGHVFIARHDGTFVRMTPEVAIAVGRKLEAAGTDSFIERVLAGNAARA